MLIKIISSNYNFFFAIDFLNKKEVYKFVGEINEMKSKVMGGQYPLAMVRWSTYSNQYASLRKYYMTHEDFFAHYRTVGDNKRYWCDHDTRRQKYQRLADYFLYV